MKTLHYLMLVASLSCLLTAFAGDGEFDLQIERAVKVSFQTQAGKFYQLQSSPSVGPSVWTTQGGTIQGNGLRHEAGFLTGSNVQAIFRVQEFDLTNGLVAFYPFNGNANDESTSGNNGSVNGASLSTDRFGNANQAYSFDGANSFIELPDSAAFKSLDFSISIWFKPDRFPEPSIASQAADFLISKGQNNFELSTGSYVNGGSGMTFLPRYGFGSDWASPSGTFQTNVWQHIIAIYQPSTNAIRLFLNGSEVLLTGPDNKPVTPDLILPARLGMRSDGTLAFKGALDSVRIYSRALNETEVGALFQLPD